MEIPLGIGKRKVDMEYDKLKKLVILCGGTGGHFYPGLTIAREFQDGGGKAYIFIGGHEDKISKQVEIASKYAIDCYTINSSGLSKILFVFIKFVLNLTKGFFKARKLLKQIKPDAVLGMGSFTSLPVSFAAISLKIPLFLHDGNARIGRANIFLSKWAKITMSAFPAVNANLIKSDYLYTGMPIRPEIMAVPQELIKENAVRKLNSVYGVNFKTENNTILIFGGSQGALTINKVLPLAVESIKNSKLQVIHLFGGEIELNPYKNLVQSSLVLKSCDRMHLLYSVADLVISRSGGSTVAELIYFHKPAILIPLPFATDQHQNDNAEFYVKKCNSVMLLNKDCNADTMKKLINIKLYEDETKECKKLCIENAAERVLTAIQNSLL